MRQTAPNPTILFDLVERLSYRPGWTFKLEDIDRGQGSEGLTLVITTLGYHSYHPERGETYGVHHYMPVPPASFDERSWRRWLFEQLLLVERHEACEFFKLEMRGDFVLRDGTHTDTFTERPFAPRHGPGNDPYVVVEYAEDVDRRTSFRGEVNP